MSRNPGIARGTVAVVAYMAVVVIASTVAVNWFEDLSWRDSFYYVVQTMWTVGYGDVSVYTESGMIVSMIMVVFGTAGFLAAVGIIGVAIFNKYAENNRRILDAIESRMNIRKDVLSEWGRDNDAHPDLMEDLRSRLEGGRKDD